MNFPSKGELEALRVKYSKGQRVELVKMEDPYSSLVPGDKGTVICVDDIGSVHISWDKGSSLAAVWKEDFIKPLASSDVILGTVHPTTLCEGDIVKWTEDPDDFWGYPRSCIGMGRVVFDKETATWFIDVLDPDGNEYGNKIPFNDFTWDNARIINR